MYILLAILKIIILRICFNLLIFSTLKPICSNDVMSMCRRLQLAWIWLTYNFIALLLMVEKMYRYPEENSIVLCKYALFCKKKYSDQACRKKTTEISIITTCIINYMYTKHYGIMFKNAGKIGSNNQVFHLGNDKIVVCTTIVKAYRANLRLFI